MSLDKDNFCVVFLFNFVLRVFIVYKTTSKKSHLIAENFGESCSNLHAFHLEYDYRGCTVFYL